MDAGEKRTITTAYNVGEATGSGMMAEIKSLYGATVGENFSSGLERLDEIEAVAVSV